MEKFRRSKESASISLFVLIACLFFVLILGGLYIKSINKLQNQEQSISQIQENYDKNLATAEEWVDENSGIKVDLSQATATEPDVLEGQTFFSGDENIKIGIMPNRGGIQKAKNQYFYTHSDGETYLVSWIPGGYYRGWQTASDGTMCAETWTPQSRIAEAAGLTSAKLLAGQTVMGVTGTATSDATANASQIISGQTAYVNGSKVTGTMPSYGVGQHAFNSGLNSYGYWYYFNPGYYATDGTGAWIYRTQSEVASMVGATASKIVSGQSIAGVSGSHVCQPHAVFAGKCWANGYANGSGYQSSSYCTGGKGTYDSWLYTAVSGYFAVWDVNDNFSCQYYNAGVRIAYTTAVSAGGPQGTMKVAYIY